jgi:hypothetical protein
MEPINEIFFGEHGLTSTSATHLANIAQETIVSHEEKLKNLNFVTTKVDIVGSPTHSEKMVNIGYDEAFLGQIRSILEEIAEMNAFCAWVREAVKAKDKELNAIDEMDIDVWCEENGFELAKEPIRPRRIYENDIIAKMNVRERNEYYQLEAIAATIGKCIHNEGPLSSARKELQNKMVKPFSTEGSGHEMLIYSHVPSVEPQKVEDIFFELQKWHRSNEQQLNKIKFDIKKRLEEENLANNQRYNTEVKEAYQKISAQISAFNKWQIEERTRLAKLKIIIPNSLQGTYDKLSRLEE